MIAHLYKHRIILIFFLFCTCYSAILIHLWSVQIYHHTFYADLAQRQYHMQIEQFPPRAPIYDRNQIPLALNTTAISAFIMPCTIKSEQRLTPFLQKHFPAAYQQFMKKKRRAFLYIKRNLSTSEVALIEQSNIPDLHLLQEPCRFYPYPCASPVVGIVNRDHHGISGIEQIRNTTLQGIASHYLLEKDGRSHYFYFSKKVHQSGREGSPIYTTIDATLQTVICNTLQMYVTKQEATEGYVLIMNPDNGELMVMAQVPFVHPQQTLDLEHLHNRIITHAYEFGSVMKVFVALAALEQQVASTDELIDCKQAKTAYVHKRKINTVKEHGIIPFKDVVAFSNNIGIAQIAFRLQDDLYLHYQRLGFGRKTILEFPGQTAGFVNHPAHWSAQSIFSLSYGYEISASILQLGCAFSIIANGGYAIDPVLLVDPTATTTKIERKQLYRPETIATIKDILMHTTQKGTTKKAAIRGYNIMSKTGTAQLLDNGIYNPDRCLFTCAGIVEKDHYKRVIVVCVKDVAQKHVYASTIAVPLFEKIAEQMLIHDKIARS